MHTSSIYRLCIVLSSTQRRHPLFISMLSDSFEYTTISIARSCLLQAAKLEQLVRRHLFYSYYSPGTLTCGTVLDWHCGSGISAPDSASEMVDNQPHPGCFAAPY